MRISDWSSDVCSSDLGFFHGEEPLFRAVSDLESAGIDRAELSLLSRESLVGEHAAGEPGDYKDTRHAAEDPDAPRHPVVRAEERRVGKEGVSTCRSRWST